MKFNKIPVTMTVAFLLIFSLASCGQNVEKSPGSSSEPSQANPMESPLAVDDDTINENEGSDKNIDDSNNNLEELSKDHVFTLEELSTYNGQNGVPAYVAVDGVVYDVSNAGAWRKGQHNGFIAGKDLTDEIKEVSPHGVKNLEGIPVVGTLASN